MIDLNRTRAELLAEIGAPAVIGEPLGDLTDARIAAADAHVRTYGRDKKDFFPLLKNALTERFAAVPRQQLIQDLFVPLRNALGNAYKHGNARNPAATICVEIVLTPKGALITVTDEGSGFDVALTFRRFQEQENYCQNHGAGFRHLHQARSTVSYENGGRTVLLCFRPTLEERRAPALRDNVAAFAQSRSAALPREAHPCPNVLDPEWVQTCLAAELPEFRNGQGRIESCRVYWTDGPADDRCGNRYVLSVASQDGLPTTTRILTGRLHATVAKAEADFEAAKRLHDAAMANRLLIPKPVGRLTGEPRLVLFDFDPWINLWEYLTSRDTLKTVRHSAERIGQGLAHLHRSPVVLPSVEPDPVAGELHRMIAQAATTLQTLRAGTDLVNRFRVSVQQLQEWVAFTQRHTRTPIHGALGWDCIHYGVNRRFFLYRFETCRQSDPGLDLGGFAADLLCFMLARHNEEAYRACLDAFLSNYNAQATHPMGADDLPFYIALALVERVGRVESPTRVDAEQLLAALAVALGQREAVSVSEMSL
jgi:anti-sigma regulatory factor (Ser/Thr protein kinase)